MPEIGFNSRLSCVEGLGLSGNKFAYSILVSAALALASCGGGGSGGSGTAPPPPPPPTNLTPSANAGADITATTSSTVVLDGSASSDPDGDQLTYSWAVSSQPAGANVSLTDATTPTPEFLTTIAGTYSFTLTVTDPSGASSSDSVTVDLSDPAMKIFKLTSGFADAEFDKVNNRVVTVFETSLTVIESDGVETTITLPHPAGAVSISPDGNFAGVTHLERVSYINLTDKTIISTIDVPVITTPENAPFSDIVLDGEGYAHLFSSAQNPETVTVNLAAESSETSETVTDQGSVAKLHPSGRTIYSLPGNKSNSGLASIDRHIKKGAMLHSLNYDGDRNGADVGVRFAICQNIWMGPENRALTGCHNVIRLSDNFEVDRKVIMRLGPDTTAIQHASSSSHSRKWFVIDYGDTNPTLDLGNDVIDVYDVDTGETLDPIELPNTSTGVDTNWSAKFVFADDDSDVLHILAVDDVNNPASYALLVHPGNAETINSGNQPPVAVAARYQSAFVGSEVMLDASDSIDPESATLSYEWVIVSEPTGSSVSPTGLNFSSVKFNPSAAGVYEFELRVSDGERESSLTRTTVNVSAVGQDLIYRLDSGVTDAEYSKSLNAIVYLSDEDYELIVVDMANFSTKTVQLSKQAHNVGISPNGLFAAVSHDDLISLIDLSTGMLIDTQATNIHFGDIVLDNNNIAHMSPAWLLFDDAFFESNDVIYSIDFDSNAIAEGGLAYNGSKLRMHPTREEIYGAWTIVSPEDVAKWDTSTFPASLIGDSPYHGDFAIGKDVWISESGDKLVTQREAVLDADVDPAKDMVYVTNLPEISRLNSADHSEERNQWIATTKNLSIKGNDIDPTVDREYFLFDDSTFALESKIDIAGVPTSAGIAPASGQQVFYSGDGTKIFMILDAESLVDNSAIQIISQD